MIMLSFISAKAGQMAGHIYTAVESIRYLNGNAKKIVESNLDAYLSGAQGPDICGVVMPKLNMLSYFNAIGEETHYSDKKAKLAIFLLSCARNDKERAYALGWISHYLNDVQVHSVVNKYGGFYEKFSAHHKELEMLETKRVLTKYSSII